MSGRKYSTFHISAAELSRPRGGKLLEEKAEDEDEGGDGGRQAVDFGSELGLSSRLASAVVSSLGLVRPTAVQRSASAALAQKRNVLIVAPTGSGKTLAYLLPMLDALHGSKREGGTKALCVAPTRELCVQIAQVASRVGRVFDVGVVPGAICGGEKRKSEKARIRKGLVLLSATPGRLLDHLKSTASLKLDAHLEWLVLDEIDRLLDLGMGPQVDELCESLGPSAKRRNVLVTATVDSRLRALAAKRLGPNHGVAAEGKEEQLLVRTPNNANSAKVLMPSKLKIEYAVVTLKVRLPALAALLASRPEAKTLVFASSCASADFHANLFGESDRLHAALHGRMDRDERRTAYAQFCRNDDDSRNAVLFATDVASRGLDFDRANVDWVLHLDAPRDVGSFVHRSGRAGRAGRSGIATLLLLPSERPLLDALSGRGIERPTRVPLPLSQDDNEVHEAWRQLQQKVANDAELMEHARDAFASHLKAYAAKAQTNLVADDAERAALDKAFKLRQLHLGHAAKCFGLDDPPKLLSRQLRKKRATHVASETSKKQHKKQAGLSATRKQPRSVGSTARALASSSLTKRKNTPHAMTHKDNEFFGV